MKIAEILIKRLQDNRYSSYLLEQHDKKWGHLELEKRPGKFFGIKRANVTSQKDEELEHKDFLRIQKYHDYMKSQDYDYLFKHLKKHIEQWWD